MRLNNWENALAIFLRAHRDLPFVWGKNDCCLFAAGAVREITGVDFAAPFRGKYSTALGSIRALKRYGNSDLLSTLIAILGEPIPILLAKRGDIALVEIEGQLSAGVHYGSVWCVGDTGLVTVLPDFVVASWSIG